MCLDTWGDSLPRQNLCASAVQVLTSSSTVVYMNDIDMWIILSLCILSTSLFVFCSLGDKTLDIRDCGLCVETLHTRTGLKKKKKKKELAWDG